MRHSVFFCFLQVLVTSAIKLRARDCRAIAPRRVRSRLVPDCGARGLGAWLHRFCGLHVALVQVKRGVELGLARKHFLDAGFVLEGSVRLNLVISHDGFFGHRWSSGCGHEVTRFGFRVIREDADFDVRKL